MADWLRTSVAGERFSVRLDLDALARLAPHRVSGPHRVPESGAITYPTETANPIGSDVSPDLADLIDSAHPRCDVITHYLDVSERCPQPATWSIRTRCVCGHRAVDLLCDEHYAGLFNPLLYRCPACNRVDQTVSRAPMRL